MPRPNLGPRLAINVAGRYEIRWTDPNGETRRRSVGTKDLAEAQARLSAFIAKLQSKPADAQLTVGELLDLYAQRHLPTTTEGKTIARSIIPRLKEVFGHLYPADITDELALEYSPTRIRRGKGATLASGTRRKHLQVLVAAVSYCGHKLKVVDKRDLLKIALPPSGDPRTRVLTPDEQARMMEAAAAERGPDGRMTRIERFCWLAYEAPYRQKRIVRLRWDQVNLEHRYIDPRPKREQQTRKRVAVVRISDMLLPILRRAYDERLTMPDGSLCPWVLDAPSTIERGFHRVRQAAGIDASFVPHVYRHTWITEAVLKGYSWTEIEGMTGDTEETLKKHYLHLRPDHLTAVANMRGAPAPKLAVGRESGR